MATVVRMPSVMANASEGAIQSWLAEEGQSVSIGDPLVEIETEKAIVEYAAEVEGTVGKLLASAGENLVVGTPIAVILAAGEGQDQIGLALEAAGVSVGDDASAAPAPETAPIAKPAAAAESMPSGQLTPAAPHARAAVAPADGSSDARRFASPIVRRLARELSIDIGTLFGTGPNGRIVRRDLDAVRAGNPPTPSGGSATSTAAAPTPTAPSASESPSPHRGAGYTDVPVTGMRRAVARRLTESKTTVPHFYVTAHINVDALFELRKTVNGAATRKISVNDFVVKAAASALVDVPAANAIWGGDHIRQFEAVDIAVAVAVDGGLFTPVVRDVHSLSLTQVSQSIADLADRARAGRIKQAELEGGSFSVSNLGMFGVDEFSAILNPPQSGILAVSAAKPRPIVDAGGQLTVATVMTVTLSADHRVIDGAVAAEWMAAFVRRIENPLTILI